MEQEFHKFQNERQRFEQQKMDEEARLRNA